ncbi:MAG TPA: hypothetical protein VK203_07965 [Nostocaceae cyanobacterium]|nr:hypothetical protein [Nostocaceae cyanobacterium]
MRLLIGIDDTDNATSGGTGNLARQLIKEIIEQNLAQVISICRHQLLVSPEIPYTSHNSSACMMVETTSDLIKPLTDCCREFLLQYSEEGSDVGLCIGEWNQVNLVVENFGKQAKEKVLTQEEALSVAKECGLFLEGLTGTKDGIIGALAAVGLRKTGNDGRFIWLSGLYDLAGVYTASQLFQAVKIDRIRDVEGKEIDKNVRIKIGGGNKVVQIFLWKWMIELGSNSLMKYTFSKVEYSQINRWPRPVLLDEQAVMLVAQASNQSQKSGEENYEYEMASKYIIRQY